MNIHIRASDFAVTHAIDTHTTERMRTALQPFQHNVVDADVFLKDVNGNKGGVDKSVVVHVRLRGRLSVAVETLDGDLYSAVNRAARRTRRAVKRSVRKRNQIEKLSVRHMPLERAQA